jgi:hypothetical protein
MRAGGDWQTISLTRTIEGCDIAAASTKDGQDTSWVHVYLVWDWLAVHATFSHKSQLSTCDWAGTLSLVFGPLRCEAALLSTPD